MKFYLFLFFLLINSCAWNQKELDQLEDFQAGKGNELLDQLDLQKDVVDKFRVEKTENPKEKKINKKVSPQRKKIAQKIIRTHQQEVRISEEYPKQYTEFDEKSVKLWKKFKPVFSPGETIVYDVTYTGITIGKVATAVTALTRIQNKDVFYFAGKLKSAPFYSYIYEIDDTIESYVTKDEFLPVKFSLIQKESNKTVNDLQLFDREELKTYYRYKKTKKGNSSFKKKDEFIPEYFQDSFSSVYFLRGIDFKVGDKFQFPIVTRGKIWIMDIDVVGIDALETEIGKRQAYKINVITRYEGDMVKSGVLNLWLAKDETKIMLKFKAEVKLGSISGDIISYQK